jgi:hypothetical protein
MACPIGMIGAPNRPCAMRARISASRLLDMPHMKDDTVKPSTVKNIVLRQPTRLASHPVMGVPMAVATRLSVTTQAISSCVAEKVPRICGSTRLASVTVMPNSMFDSCTISRTSHCRPVRLKRPPCAAWALTCDVSSCVWWGLGPSLESLYTRFPDGTQGLGCRRERAFRRWLIRRDAMAHQLGGTLVDLARAGDQSTRRAVGTSSTRLVSGGSNSA